MAKTYTIDKYKFTLNTDLTLDEGEEVQKFMSKLFAQDQMTIAGSYTSEEIRRFFEIVLTPIGELPKDFSFGKTKESVQMEVFKDFFLHRVNLGKSIVKGLSELTEQQPKPSES
jgi:hypothetical protein